MSFTNIMTNAINRFGNTITVVNKTTTYDPVYGDESTSTSTYSTIAAMNSITGAEEWNKSGYYAPNDKIFFIKGTDTISLGDEIIMSGKTYRVSEEPIEHYIDNTVQHYECRCRRT